MVPKQLFMDIAIVLLVPGLLIAVWYFGFRSPDSALLSVVTGRTPAGQEKPGARAIKALSTLESITLDDSIFNDPAFQEYQYFPVTIPTPELGRPYPFTPPPVIQEMNNKAKTLSQH